MSTSSITFDLDSTDYTARLAFEVLLNDTVVFATEHVARPVTVEFDVVDDEEGEHEFKFVLKNKTQDHTTVDEHGNIVSDAVLSIANMSVDGIKLGHMFFEQTSYHHDTNGSQLFIKDKFFGSMGCNGYVSLKFSTPIYLWLLENM
jgi:hypothetical protein